MKEKLEALRARLGLAEGASFEVIKAAMTSLSEADQWSEDEVTELGKFLQETDSIIRMSDAIGQAMSAGMAESMGALQGSVAALVEATKAQEQAQLALQNDPKKARRLTKDGDENRARVTFMGSEYDLWDWNDDHFALAYGLQSALNKLDPGKHSRPSEKLTNATKEAYPQHALAMDTGETGFGAELIASETLASIWRQARLESLVSSLFNFIQMPSETTPIPIDGGLPEFLFVSEATTSTASNFATSKTGTGRRNLVAQKLICHQIWSGELEEDSIIPFVPFIQQQLGTSAAFYLDSLVLNGDTTNASTGNINLDDADPADTKHYLALDGIRHLPLVTNVGNEQNTNAAMTAANLLKLRALMGVWGTNGAQCAFIMDMQTFASIMGLEQVLTVDKFGAGNRATIRTGQLGSIIGSPIIVSEAMSLTEADGKVSTSAANNIKGQIICVNRTGWLGGYRRTLQLEFERIPATDQSRLVASMRVAFINWGTDVASVARNITI